VVSVGFLHTSAIHVLTFRALLAEVAPDAIDVQLVDESLLADARTRGVEDARLLSRLAELADCGPDVIVCTCSTLGGDAERVGSRLGLPVVRVDRPMAQRAVANGGRVAIVAAVESTLLPTRMLLEECAVGTGAVIIDAPCLDAWPLFEAGDQAGYLARIAGHARTLDADVIVLAQASMASATELLDDLRIPVLSSPRLAVLRAVEMASGR
jgi:Asp/Glu/hydantoin racemase